MYRVTLPVGMKMLMYLIFVLTGVLLQTKLQAQTCPPNSTTTISSWPNTYYPGLTSTINAGNTSIDLGATVYGSTPISSGDLLLIIQMQGAQITAANDSTYGKGVTGGGHVHGYLNNSGLLAGNMEYAVANSAVPLTGGTLTLLNGVNNNYQHSAFGTDGQYSYQVIRVGAYYNLTIGANITVPSWNGSTGGVMVLCVTNLLDMNGYTISAAGAGFRGGAGRQLNGSGSGVNTDFITVATNNANASKGEGIAGTPRYVNNNGILLDNGVEGYPLGSYAMGAPGNAGGGGTDGAPNVNTQNSGGGGGSNGGMGGKGGNSWNTNLVRGGEPGAVFAQYGATRLVMGGGGGAGSNNDGTGTLTNGLSSSGAAGGGMVIIYANSILNSGIIDVSGASSGYSVANDAGGGGGAGGSALLSTVTGLFNITVYATGGNGASDNMSAPTGPHGPGGGGGGGVVYANAPLNAASSVSGGLHGVTTTSNNIYGSQSGAAGILLQNAALPSPSNCFVLPVTRPPVARTNNNEAVQIDWRMTIKPNPVSSMAVITITSAINTTASIRLFNTSGHTVLHKRYDVRKGMNQFSLQNLQAFPTGVYLLQYNDGTNCKNIKMLMER